MGRAQRIVKRVAEAADVVRPPSAGVVVLAYHRVGGRSGLDVDLPFSVFEAQMEQLAASGRVRSLDDAKTLLDRPETEPSTERPIVLTFDDGTADFADEAVPVLARLGLPATVYVATRFVDEGVSFPHAGTPLTWSALRDAASSGFVTVGSHTHGHILLDRAEPAAAADDLDRSIELIAEHVGVPPKHFAYPKGLSGSADVEPLVRARFETAAVGGTRANPPGATDLHRLRRSPIQVSDGERWFARKIAGGMALEDSLRRLVNRRRYAGATT